MPDHICSTCAKCNGRYLNGCAVFGNNPPEGFAEKNLPGKTGSCWLWTDDKLWQGRAQAAMELYRADPARAIYEARREAGYE